MKFLDAHTHLSGSETGETSRKELREQIFYKNVLQHWQSALREPQQPQRAKRRIKTPRARASHGHEAGRRS